MKTKFSISERVNQKSEALMKFNWKKTGFTLGETLIVLLIITILTLFSIITIRSRSNTTLPLYWRAYEALSIAAYNGWLDAGEKGNTFGSNTATLCNQLAGTDGWINVSEGQIYCTRPGLSIPTDTTENPFTDTNLHFVASNSMRFYISQELNGTHPLNNYIRDPAAGNTASNRVNPRWHIIFVDLDGEKGLNTMKQPANPSNTADVVAFAIVIDPNEMPSVIPIGVPTMDKRYMTAVVKYTNNNSGRDRKSPGLRYKEAVIRAYGRISTSGTTTIPERIYFEHIIGSSNKLFYVALPTESESAGSTTIDSNSKASSLIASPGCEEDQLGACSVIINSYTGASRN